MIDCIIIKKNENIIVQEGKSCNTLYAPNSTFKIPLAVIGFESGILKNAHSPVWQPQYPVKFLQYYHDGEQSPSSWMRFSMPWYSQELVKKLAKKNMKQYIETLGYGNMDLTGANDENNMPKFWLSSSLKITPLQQLEFIKKLAKNKLPFSISAQEKTKDLIKLMEESAFANWWSIHGKTGSGSNEGYFVGFAEKDGDIVSFVIHISNIKNLGGIKAKQIIMQKMIDEKIFQI
jgi:beta-lactamase class D